MEETQNQLTLKILDKYFWKYTHYLQKNGHFSVNSTIVGSSSIHSNSIEPNCDNIRKIKETQIYNMGFIFMKFEEQEKRITHLEDINDKLLTELKDALTVINAKKPIDDEIAELQERIMKLYAEKDKN